MAVPGSVETEPVAEVVVPVAGLAEIGAPVAVRVVAVEVVVAVATPESVAGTVIAPEAVATVAFEPVADPVDGETPLEVFVGAVFVGRTDA